MPVGKEPMATEKSTCSVPQEHQGKRLDVVAALLFPGYSRSELARRIDAGYLLLNGKGSTPKTKVHELDLIELLEVTRTNTSSDKAEKLNLDIVFEDEDLLVINKQPGLTVHPGAGVSSGTLMNGLLYHRPGLEALPRAGIVHRLDKDTSGLMVVAGSLSAHKVLTEAILDRSLSRSYEAVCEGVLISGQDIDAPIGRDPRNRLKKAVRQDGKNSLSIMRIIKRYRKHSLVKVSLATGRTHQIRVHMQSIGHPLVGDRRYGCRYLLPKMADEVTIRTIRGFKRQALHSRRLEFAHPRGGSPQRFVADRPGDMEELVDALELDFEKYS